MGWSVDWAARMRSASPAPAAFTRRPRPNGPRDIAQLQWHATRGKVAMDRQVEATENWFANQPDLGGWGASSDFIVGPDARQGGRVAIVWCGDTLNTYSSWSAGFGNAGTLPAAQYGFAVEVAQPAPRSRATGQFLERDDPANPDTVYEEFTAETVEACAFLVTHLNDALRGVGIAPIPSVWLGDWDQSPARPVPRGHIGHDTLANGYKLGKSDPGRLFPLGEIFRLVDLGGPLPNAPDPIATARLEGYGAALGDVRDRIMQLAGDHGLGI